MHDLLAPLLKFLDDTRGAGWSGSANDLGPLVGQYIEGASSVLPTFEAGWIEALRDLAPDLARAGWVVRALQVGSPVEFVRYSDAKAG